MNTRSYAPPPIGEAIQQGWIAYKANLGPVLLGTLCAMLCGMVPLIGGFLALPGMYCVALKAVRGQKPEPSDGFVGFKALGDHIIIGLLMALGILFCIVGVYLTRPLFLPGVFYVMDQKLSWSQAKDKCMAEVKPNLFSWLLFDFVIMFLAGFVGVLLCGVGVFFTAPWAACAIAYAYEKSLNKGSQLAASADVAIAPVMEQPPPGV
jgi:hypothetical protein